MLFSRTSEQMQQSENQGRDRCESPFIASYSSRRVSPYRQVAGNPKETVQRVTLEVRIGMPIVPARYPVLAPGGREFLRKRSETLQASVVMVCSNEILQR